MNTWINAGSGGPLHCRKQSIAEEQLRELMFRTGPNAIRTVLIGREAVRVGLINEVGGGPSLGQVGGNDRCKGR